MRTSVLSLGAVVLLTLADCTDKGNSPGSGTSSSAGATNSAGTSSSASATNSAGTNSSAGATNSGGTSSSAGATGAAGATMTSGGSMATGGASSTGGSGASGSTPGSAGSSGGAATTVYQGPCDLLTGGCAEAYSVTRAMTASYKGPLFQLGLAADKNAKTLDIGQTAAHTADMTTWSAY